MLVAVWLWNLGFFTSEKAENWNFLLFFVANLVRFCLFLLQILSNLVGFCFLLELSVPFCLQNADACVFIVSVCSKNDKMFQKILWRSNLDTPPLFSA
jgi:hypothetical protein